MTVKVEKCEGGIIDACSKSSTLDMSHEGKKF